MTDKSDLEKQINDTDQKIPHSSGLIEKHIIMLKLLKQKVKYWVLMVKQLILHYLQMKIKYLMLVIKAKNEIIMQKYQ